MCSSLSRKTPTLKTGGATTTSPSSSSTSTPTHPPKTQARSTPTSRLKASREHKNQLTPNRAETKRFNLSWDNTQLPKHRITLQPKTTKGILCKLYLPTNSQTQAALLQYHNITLSKSQKLLPLCPLQAIKGRAMVKWVVLQLKSAGVSSSMTATSTSQLPACRWPATKKSKRNSTNSTPTKPARSQNSAASSATASRQPTLALTSTPSKTTSTS